MSESPDPAVSEDCPRGLAHAAVCGESGKYWRWHAGVSGELAVVSFVGAVVLCFSGLLVPDHFLGGLVFGLLYPLSARALLGERYGRSALLLFFGLFVSVSIPDFPAEDRVSMMMNTGVGGALSLNALIWLMHRHYRSVCRCKCPMVAYDADWMRRK